MRMANSTELGTPSGVLDDFVLTSAGGVDKMNIWEGC